MQTAVGPAPGQGFGCQDLAPLPVRAGSAAPPPSWRQIRLWGSPAGGGSGPPPARRSGPHRHGRHPSATQPERWGDPALGFLHHVFGPPGAERVHGPRVVQAAAQTPAEGWTAVGAAGGGLGETTEGASWLQGSSAEDAGRLPQRCPRRNLAERPLRNLSPHPRAGSRGYFRPTQARWWLRATRSPSPSGPLWREGYAPASLGAGSMGSVQSQLLLRLRGWRGGTRVFTSKAPECTRMK